MHEGEIRIMKKNIRYGMAAIGALASLGALTVAVIRKKKDEELYREAELKAMQELDEIIGEDDKCTGCSCAEECAACEPEDEGAPAGEEAPAEEPAAEEAPEAEEAPAEEETPSEEA